MTNKELAQKLLDLLGGKDNVLANAACMTRDGPGRGRHDADRAGSGQGE